MARIMTEQTGIVDMGELLAGDVKKLLGNEEQRFRCDYANCGRVLYPDNTKLFKCTACGHGTMRPAPPKAHCCECGQPIYFNVDKNRDVVCGECTAKKVEGIGESEKETGKKITNAGRLQQALLIKESKAKGWTGNTLREARKKKGWSQRQLAALWDVSRQFIQKMEDDCKPLILKALGFIKENCA